MPPGRARQLFIARRCSRVDLREVPARRPAARHEYHYVGCGTVGNLINDRRLIWKDEGYTSMRDYLNILAQPDTRGRLRNIEVFPEHKDWQRRAEQPYVLFDPDRTAFNLTNPHLVAMFEPSNGVSERWCTDTVSSELRRLFFTRTRQHLKNLAASQPASEATHSLRTA